jgi:hypothetical protein
MVISVSDPFVVKPDRLLALVFTEGIPAGDHGVSIYRSQDVAAKGRVFYIQK